MRTPSIFGRIRTEHEKNSPPLSTTTVKPASTRLLTLSGARLTRFSPPNVSLSTPTVRSAYGMGPPSIPVESSVKASAGSYGRTGLMDLAADMASTVDFSSLALSSIVERRDRRAVRPAATAGRDGEVNPSAARGDRSRTSGSAEPMALIVFFVCSWGDGTFRGLWASDPYFKLRTFAKMRIVSRQKSRRLKSTMRTPVFLSAFLLDENEDRRK